MNNIKLQNIFDIFWLLIFLLAVIFGHSYPAILLVVVAGWVFVQVSIRGVTAVQKLF